MGLYSVRLHLMYQPNSLKEKLAYVLYHETYYSIACDKESTTLSEFTESVKKLMKNGSNEGVLSKILIYGQTEDYVDISHDFSSFIDLPIDKLSKKIYNFCEKNIC